MGGAEGSPLAKSSEGAMSPSKIDGRRGRPPFGAPSAISRSDRKFGPAGDAALVSRQVKSGS